MYKPGDMGYVGVGTSGPSFGMLPYVVSDGTEMFPQSFSAWNQTPQMNQTPKAANVAAQHGTQPVSTPLFGGVGSDRAMSPTQFQPPSNPYLQGYSPGQNNPGWQPMVNSMNAQAQASAGKMLNQIGRNAISNGAYGDARHGVAEGEAIGALNTNLGTNLAQMGFNQYNTDNNFDLASWQANQNNMQTGAMNQINALDKLLNWNQTYGIGNTTATQNTPLNYWQQFANTGSQMGGLGGSQSQNMPGNPWLGALGGYQLGKSLFGG